MEYFQNIFRCLEQEHHVLPTTNALWNVVNKINDVTISQSFLSIFRYFDNPPSVRENFLLQSFVNTISKNCSIGTLIDLFDSIGLLDASVQQCLLRFLDNQMFNILCNLRVVNTKAWINSEQFRMYQLPKCDDIPKLLNHFDPTDNTGVYLDFMRIAEAPLHSLPVKDILITKLKFILSRQGYLVLFKIFLGEGQFSVIVGHFDDIEGFLRMHSLEPTDEPFQPFTQHLAKYDRPLDNYTKRVIKAFFPPIFARMSMYDSPEQILFPESMLGENASEIFMFFMDECLSYWLQAFVSEDLFKSHQSLANSLQLILGTQKSNYDCILVNVISFSNCFLSKGRQITSDHFLNQLKNSFAKLFNELNEITADLLDELHNNFHLLFEIECAFHFSSLLPAPLPTVNLQTMKVAVDEWNQQIVDDIKFISATRLYLPHAMQTNFLKVVSIADNSKDLSKSKVSITEIRRIHAELSQFSRFFSESSKRFFLHFALNSDESVLFKESISPSESLTARVLHTPEALAEHISSVEKYLQKLCTTKLTMQEVRSISEQLSRNDRKPALELKILHSFFSEGVLSEEQIQTLIRIQEDVMNLFVARDQLIEFVFGSDSKPSTLEMLQFTFEGDDPIFQWLQHLVGKLRNKDRLLNLTSDECVDILKAILNCFGVKKNTDNQVDVMRGVIELFFSLTEADKVWKFFKDRPEFVSDEQSFKSKLDVLFAELNKEDYRLVDSFRAASFWVCLVSPMIGSPFSEVVAKVTASERFSLEIAHPPAFHELITTQANMDFITHLFQYGCTGLDSVLAQFKCLTSKSSIEFDLMTHQLQVRYLDDKRKSEVLMSSDQVIEFEQRLEFIKTEEKSPFHDISIYLKQLAIYRRGMNVLRGLFEYGHPLFKNAVFKLTYDDFVLHSQSAELEIACAWVAELQRTLDGWVATIKDAQMNDSILRLFTIKQARRMVSLIVDGSIHKLFNSIAHLFVDKGSKRKDVFAALEKSVINTLQNANDDWLRTFQIFFRELLSSGASLRSFPIASVESSESNIRDISSSDPLTLKRLICYIFGKWRPESFQILWCTAQLKKEDILNYLQTAKSFPNLRFAVVQYNLLSQGVQNEFFKSIFQDKELIRNLHFVECGPSIMKSASWLPVVDARDVCNNVDLNSCYSEWFKHAGEPFTRENQLCYVGPSGSGKSHQIRKLIEQFPKSLIIPITEDFDCDEILPRMSEGLASTTDDKMLLVFQVNIGKLRDNAVARWTALTSKIDDLMFQLLILRSVAVLDSEYIVNLPWGSNCTVVLELPYRAEHLDGVITDHGVEDELPTIHAIFKFMDASKMPFDIDDQTRLVCKYLKAFETGIIDTLYVPDITETDIIFVLDCSGSMHANDRLDICKNQLKTIMDVKLRPNFRVGLVLFNHDLKEVPLKPLDQNREKLKDAINRAEAGGGSNMWTALKRALEMLLLPRIPTKRILVALTDGDAADALKGGRADSVMTSLSNAHSDVQVLFITVKLNEECRNEINKRCIRNPHDKLVDAEDGDSLHDAWITIGDILTVSQIIEKRSADITSEECNRLLDKYMINRNTWSKFQQVFWVRYMHRRCRILSSSERFNTNLDKPDFGKTTMEIMLKEVERTLSNDHQVDWNSVRHEQMVFRKQIIGIDGIAQENYTWSILCSNPNDRDSDWLERKEKLRGHGIQVPTMEDLERPDRRVLDSYLAYGIGVELEAVRKENSSSGSPFDFELGSLYLRNTVLTLDFTIKLLTINERVECGIPCIMQGETGVSKTELVRMLFTLKNGSMQKSHLFAMLKYDSRLINRPSFDAQKLSALHMIAKYWELSKLSNVQKSWHDCDQLFDAIRVSCTDEKLQKFLFDELRANPVLDPLEHFTDHDKFKDPRNSIKLLQWFVESVSNHIVHDVHWTFSSVNVHAAMKMKEIESIIMSVSHKGQRILQLGEYLKSPVHMNTKLCIFFDEFNTSSHMGIMKEVITNHTINGVTIARNVVIVAACNPARKKLKLFSDRKQEHGIEWVTGDYQTHPLPPSIEAIVWNYGSLLANQEKEFIKKRLDAEIKTKTSSEELNKLTNLIYQAHQITREMAKLHLKTLVDESGLKIPEDEVVARAKSALSLRDILRCFKIFQYLSTAPAIVRSTLIGDNNVSNKSIWLLAIGIVYYLRLGVDTSKPGRNYRRQFMNEFKSICGLDADVRGYTKTAMKNLRKQTELPQGIAPTDGLQENIYVVLVCLMAKVPVMIVGPPGSSKTLAISILVDNARGEYSKTEIYKSLSTAIPFHYQCSRRSTSTQVAEVFERAIERQAKAVREVAQVLCFVFMDEAGLPEEGRESLKVLHYYLENHMKVQAEVGFVAISNHVLDAAKTNRCTLLMRNQPDETELLEITKGCSQQQLDWNLCSCYISSIEPDGTIRPLYVNDLEVKYNLFDYLCKSFEACVSKIHDFLEFFGLRDYMYFIMLLGRLAKREQIINRRMIYTALERNFNGFSKLITKDIITRFMGGFLSSEPSQLMRLSNPIDLLMTSLTEQFQSNEPAGRYIMVIDTTTCDGILRFLVEHVVGRIRKLRPLLLKLSDFTEDSHTQQMNLISQTRFAMERGDFIVLSHCEATHESFYDLFNHRFRKFMDKHEVIYHTNIAVGGDSRRCRVDPQFQCLMHLSVAELNIAPAPFLNRFEKYRITMVDALEYILSHHPCRLDFPLATVVENVLLHLRSLFGLVGYESFLGYAHKQTVESCFVQILLKLNSVSAIEKYVLKGIRTFTNSLSSEDRVEVDNARANNCFMRDYFKCPINERIRNIGVEILAQAILLDAAQCFIDISLPECILAKSAFLPPSLIDMVVTKEKFRLDHSKTHSKSIIFTRSTAELVELQAINQGHQRVNWIALSEFKKESQFTEKVAMFLISDSSDHMIVVIELCSTPLSMINFVRNKLESVHSPNKRFTILIHGANVDIRSHCIYDVVFDQNWEQMFIDGFCDTCDLSWLQIAYTLDIVNSDKISDILHQKSDAYVLFALEIISEKLAISREGSGEIKNKFRGALEIFLREKLVNSYAEFWFVKPMQVSDAEIAWDAPANYSLLRQEIQLIVQKYAVNSFSISLLQYIEEEMNSMFTRIVLYYIGAVFEDITVGDFIENAVDRVLMDLLEVGLAIFPQPYLGVLQAPINYFLFSIPKEKSFPFFRRLHRFLQDQVSRVVPLYEEDDKSEDKWVNIITYFITNYIEQHQDIFEVKFYVHIRAVEESVWKLYLEKFVSVKFPGASDLQCRFLSFWLERKVRFISEENPSLVSSNIVLLYMMCAIHECLLQSFLDCLSQIQFSTTEESIQNYLDGFNDDDTIDDESNIITEGFIRICYDAMLSCNTCEDYLSWTQSVSSLLLTYENCDDRLMRKMTAVMTVSLLLTEKQWKVDSISDFRDNLHADDSPLPFDHILSLFNHSFATDIIDLDVISLLIRNSGARLSDQDKVWMMDNITVDTVMVSPIQWAPLLDILLFGIIDETAIISSSFPSSMVEWITLVADKKLLDTKLKASNSNAGYVPDFLRDSGVPSAFSFLADVAFHVIWKWIHTFLARDASIIQINSLEDELGHINEQRDDAKNTIKIAATACDLFIIKRWTDSIFGKDVSCQETQRIIIDVVHNRKPRMAWINYTRRLFLQPNVSEGVESLSEIIQQWRIKNCEENLILKKWLEDCKVQDESKLVDFAFQSCLNISRSSNADEDPITLTDSFSNDSAFSFVGGLDKLMCIWVLPYIWEFYQWLTEEMNSYKIDVNDVRTLKIGQMMESCKKKSDPKYYSCCVLWAKLKIGTRQYISTSGHSKGLDKVDEETSVWNLVSTCNQSETQNGILIDIMEAILKDCKPILDGSDGRTSDEVQQSQSFQHLKNVEKLLSFFPKLIESNLNLEGSNYEESFSDKLSGCTRTLSHFGSWQRLIWIAETQQNPLLLKLEIQRIRNIIPKLLHFRVKPILCTFGGSNQDLSIVSESYFDPTFHSLEKHEVHSLIRSLQFYESMANSDGSDFIQQILKTVHGENSFDMSQIFGIVKPNQIAFLASLQFKEVPKLIGYLNALLQSEIFLFSNKPLELKKAWPSLVDEKIKDIFVEDPQFIRSAKQLEALLIQHESALSDNCDYLLKSVLERFFKSADVLLEQYPLLKDILTIFEATDSCSLVCGHYMRLRLKLRHWITSFKSRMPERAWGWSIKAGNVNASKPASDTISKHKIPWFMQTAVALEAYQPEVENKKRWRERKAASRIQRFWKSVRGKLRSSTKSNDSRVQNSTTGETTQKKSRVIKSLPDSRFLGRGGITGGSQAFKDQNLKEALKFLVNDLKLKLSFINKLKIIVEDKLFLAPERQNDSYFKAVEHINIFWTEINQRCQELADLMAAKPINQIKLQAVRDRLTEMEYHNISIRRKFGEPASKSVPIQATAYFPLEMEATDEEQYKRYKRAGRHLYRVESLLSEECNILDKKMSSMSEIKKVVKEAEILGIELNPIILQLKSVLEKDAQIISEVLKSWALSDTVLETLMQACEYFPNIVDPFLLESTTPAQRAQITDNGYIDKVKGYDNDRTLGNTFEKLRKDVQNDPLYSWVHSDALVAAISVMPSQFEVHRYKAWGYVKNYLETVNRQPKKEVANIIMLVLARIVPNCGAAFRKACLRKVYSEKTASWFTDAEVEVLQSPLEDIDAITDTVARYTIATHFPCIDRIMELVGLEKVKEKVLELAKQFLDPEYRVSQCHHFILLGNPGTGKTTVAKVIQKLLTDSGIRSSPPFIEKTGEAIMQMEIDRFSALLDSAKNGVIFIDDAHALSSNRTADETAIIDLILDPTESRWRDTSLILAGYKDGIENNLIKFSSDFSSPRFHHLIFDDYTEEELGSIFCQMCENHYRWKWANEDVVRAAAHRISRERRRSTFANAKSVDNFLATISTQCSGKNQSRTFYLADVIGPKPDPQVNFTLKAALDQLNAMIGLDAVKNEVNRLINSVMMNYEHILHG